jgi:hypothetical protein
LKKIFINLNYFFIYFLGVCQKSPKNRENPKKDQNISSKFLRKKIFNFLKKFCQFFSFWVDPPLAQKWSKSGVFSDFSKPEKPPNFGVFRGFSKFVRFCDFAKIEKSAKFAVFAKSEKS